MLNYDPILSIDFNADQIKQGTPNPGADIELHRGNLRTTSVSFSPDQVKYSSRLTKGVLNATVYEDGNVDFAFYLNSMFKLKNDPNLRTITPPMNRNRPSYQPIIEGSCSVEDFQTHYEAANEAYSALQRGEVITEYPLKKDTIDGLVHSINTCLFN